MIDTSLSGARVATELHAIIAAGGVLSLMIVSDNGTELTSLAILKTQGGPSGGTTSLPGKTQQKAESGASTDVSATSDSRDAVQCPSATPLAAAAVA